MKTSRPLPGRQRLRSLLLSFALLLATGFVAPNSAANVNDAVDQTAFAIPRIGMPGAHSVALPQPLSPGDVAHIRHIFDLQRSGAIAQATHEMDFLESDILRGSILADRYLNTGYIPQAAELSAWLSRFAQEPDAPAIQALLGTLSAPASEQSGMSPVPSSTTETSEKALSGIPARTFLVQNHDLDAVATARQLLSHPNVDQRADSLFAGGVAAWRIRDFVTSRLLFEAAWRAAGSAPLRAASAFWASRLAEKTQDRGSRVFWLRRAATEADTFYGAVAAPALTALIPCVPSLSANKTVVTDADAEALLATASGRRSFALLQVGERQRAENELRTLWFDSGPMSPLARSLILVARAVGFNRFAEELRGTTASAMATLGKFELPLLRPAGGFRMDPSFVYAVVRHESNFEPLAISPVGARGLMQVMPTTAVGMGAIGEGQTDRLNDPSTNLDIGQHYLLQLSANPLVGDDLLKLIAAYGEGPSGMDRWAKDVRDHDDPFVFLEAIPSPFMRQFIEDVLVYQWQYAAALRLRASSLDDLVAGIYPRFTPIKAIPGGMKAQPEVCAAPRSDPFRG